MPDRDPKNKKQKTKVRNDMRFTKHKYSLLMGAIFAILGVHQMGFADQAPSLKINLQDIRPNGGNGYLVDWGPYTCHLIPTDLYDTKFKEFKFAEMNAIKNTQVSYGTNDVSAAEIILPVKAGQPPLIQYVVDIVFSDNNPTVSSLHCKSHPMKRWVAVPFGEVPSR